MRITGWGAVALTAVALTAGACGASDAATDNPAAAEPRVDSTTTTSEPILIDRLHAAGCVQDESVLTTAVQAYRAMHDGTPSETDLVASQVLSVASEYHDLDASGAVIPAPGGPCI